MKYFWIATACLLIAGCKSSQSVPAGGDVSTVPADRSAQISASKRNPTNANVTTGDPLPDEAERDERAVSTAAPPQQARRTSEVVPADRSAQISASKRNPAAPGVTDGSPGAAREVQSPPENVRMVFQERFPKAQEDSWFEQSGGYYVLYRMNNESWRSDFSPEGKWLSDERSVTVQTLPAAVQRAISNHANREGMSVYEIKTEGNQRVYRVQRASGPTFDQTYFNTQGRAIDKYW